MENKLGIIYASCLMSRKTLEKVFSLVSGSVGLEIQKYHRLLVEGFKNNNVDVKAISFQADLNNMEDIDSTETYEDVDFTYLKSNKKHFLHL